MGLRLVAIEVDAASPRPVFRITSPTGPVRILILGVSHADLNEPAWEIMTADWASRPSYTATTQIILEPAQVRAPFEPGFEIEGESWDLLVSLEDNREVSSVTYGEVPTGFQQTHPEQGAPPPLHPGERYKVAVMGACFGQAAFTA